MDIIRGAGPLTRSVTNARKEHHMRVAIASDHGGFEQKEQLISYLKDGLGCEVTDFGTTSEESVDSITRDWAFVR